PPPLSAGIFAILGVEVTRMRGVRSSFIRFVASVLGLFLASMLFETLGYHIWTVSIFILITFPLLSRFQLKEGIITCSVIVFHIFDRGHVTTELIGNEVMLLIAGLGWATIINFLYMPAEDKKLRQLRDETERLLAAIFEQISRTLRDPSYVWDGRELLDAHRTIEQGIRRSTISRENRFVRGEQYWEIYYRMRNDQLESIQQMLVLLAFVYESVPQGGLIADVFQSLSKDVHSDVYEGNAERKLEELEQQFRAMELPKTRQEFEVRATLFQMCKELRRFIEVAKQHKQKKQDELIHLS
uniref:aromatic acid exporter family protein n=1 Tax=Paenibacillus xylaniclasticus TaxID=588083 RepID=UPI000FDCC943